MASLISWYSQSQASLSRSTISQLIVDLQTSAHSAEKSLLMFPRMFASFKFAAYMQSRRLHLSHEVGFLLSNQLSGRSCFVRSIAYSPGDTLLPVKLQTGKHSWCPLLVSSLRIMHTCKPLTPASGALIKSPLRNLMRVICLCILFRTLMGLVKLLCVWGRTC